MSVLTNKHTVIAVIVAPVLAILSYYGIGYLFGEKPQVAREGQSYPLAEKPNCRWESGRCGLKNADFELELSVSSRTGEGMELRLESVHPLEGVMLALARPDDAESSPRAMRIADADGLAWTIDIDLPQPKQDRLQLVAAAGHSYWYGDVSTSFTEK
jgi:hypothetical protein